MTRAQLLLLVVLVSNDDLHEAKLEKFIADSAALAREQAMPWHGVLLGV